MRVVWRCMLRAHRRRADVGVCPFDWCSAPDSGRYRRSFSHRPVAARVAVTMSAPGRRQQPQPRRKTLSFREKIAVINAVSSGKEKKKDVAARFGVRPSTLSTILKSKERIFTAVSSGTSGARKKLRASNYADVEKTVLRWTLDMRTRNVPLTGTMLQEKAREVACQLGCSDFKASPGWLMRFKNRHASLAGLRRGEWLPLPELNAVPLDDVEDVRDALREYRARDVYAAQEMALFYRMLPHETRAFKEDTCAGGSRSGQRLTVFLCSNMDGSDKRAPLVIGRSDRPRCFRGSKSVPVKYMSHPKAWMTPLVFCNWLCDFNAHMAEENRLVCLLVSRCAAHMVGDLSLSNVRLCYVSTEGTSLPCPLNLGVVHRVKCAYRQSLIERLLLNTRNAKDMNVDVFESLQMLAEAWKSVKPAVITACFRRAGVDVKVDISLLSRESEVDHVVALPSTVAKPWHLLRICGFVPEDVTLNDFLYSDSWAVTTEEENDEVILGSVQDDSLCEDQENCDTAVLPIPTSKDVLNAISVLRTFAGSQEDLGAAFEAIYEYESCVRPVLWKQMKTLMKLDQGGIVSGVELLAEAALTATERLDTEVILLQGDEIIKAEVEEVVEELAEPLEPVDTEVPIDPETCVVDEQPPHRLSEPEEELVEVLEQHPESEVAILQQSDSSRMDVEQAEDPVLVVPVQQQQQQLPMVVQPAVQRETSHSSIESGPVAVPLVPIQPVDITYSDDSQSKSLPGLTGASTHHQPTGFDSSMFKMGTPLPEAMQLQPPAVHAEFMPTPMPPYPSTMAHTGAFPLVATPSTSLGGVSSTVVGGETDDMGSSSVSSKVHKDKKKKKKKDKKHKHKHKHRSHDRLLEKERFYSSGGSTNQSPAPFGGGTSGSPQHEII